MSMDEMVETLRALRQTASDAYDERAFPGTARWVRANEADRLVAEYEAEHPEAVAEINRRWVEAREARLAGRDYTGF
jgi:hypothetical protein